LVKKAEILIYQLSRPLRDRAIVFVILFTGLRREELCKLDIDQLKPNTPEELRNARKAMINKVKGKSKTERLVFLSADARDALADYLEKERIHDAPGSNGPLFVSAMGIPMRAKDGRMSPRSINSILDQIGKWHDA